MATGESFLKNYFAPQWIGEQFLLCKYYNTWESRKINIAVEIGPK
jgi:hypothetical protein